MIKQQSRVLKRVLFFTDLILVIVAFFTGYLIRASFEGILPLDVYIGLLPISLIIWGSLLYSFGMYRSSGMRQISEILIITFKTAVIGFVLFGSYIFFLHLQEQVTRSFMGIAFALASFLIVFEKIILVYLFRHLGSKSATFKGALFTYRNILIIGTGKRAKDFVALIDENPDWSFKIVGFVDMDRSKKGALIGGYKVLGSLNDIPELIHENVIDDIVFIVPRSWLNKIEEVMLFCESEGLTINLAVDLFNLKISKLRQTDLHGFPLLTFESKSHKLEYLFIKRMFDFVLAGFGLLVLSPIFLILAIIIKATSQGSVFFKQERCSLYGRKFVFYKFRTMVADAEEKLEEILQYNEMSGPVFKMTDDPRVTKIGAFLRKCSIDELPQLWNVIKGDMSLVGPRPPIPAEVEYYNNWHRRKLSMRPGITCLWQISGRSDIADFNEWMKLDLEYIDSWSLLLDFKILLKTILVVLLGQGAK